jgi:hypothetical protein
MEAEDNSAQQYPETKPEPAKWWRLKNAPHFFSKSEWVMVFLTAVIAFTGVVGIVLVFESGGDTLKMIGAAQKQADAADRQACAAKKFADTAVLINGNINDAVIKLDKQAGDTHTLAQTANTSLYLEERPWVGLTPLVIARKMGSDGLPSDNAEAQVVNSGRSPSVNVSVVSGMYVHKGKYTPDTLDQQYITRIVDLKRAGKLHGHVSPSGDGMYFEILPTNDPHLLPPGDMERPILLIPELSSLGTLPPSIPYPIPLPGKWIVGDATVIVYGQIEYADTIRGSKHTTRFCEYRPDPTVAKLVACPVYNGMD